MIIGVLCGNVSMRFMEALVVLTVPLPDKTPVSSMATGLTVKSEPPGVLLDSVIFIFTVVRPGRFQVSCILLKFIVSAPAANTRELKGSV
jgi:hypothetical protein